jgi:hypothetical protein
MAQMNLRARRNEAGMKIGVELIFAAIKDKGERSTSAFDLRSQSHLNAVMLFMLFGNSRDFACLHAAAAVRCRPSLPSAESQIQ